MIKLYRNLKQLAIANKREVGFILLFIGIFSVEQSLYFFSRYISVPSAIQSVNTAVSAAIINVITPAEEVLSQGNTLQSSSGYMLNISWGCEGVEGIFLIIAALIAYRMSLRRKLIGIATGTAFILMINIVRLVSLYYTVKYQPRLFDLMHIYIGQTFIIFFGVIFFMFWILLGTEPIHK